MMRTNRSAEAPRVATERWAAAGALAVDPLASAMGLAGLDGLVDLDGDEATRDGDRSDFGEDVRFMGKR
jgi:hypothetical protein